APRSPAPARPGAEPRPRPRRAPAPRRRPASRPRARAGPAGTAGRWPGRCGSWLRGLRLEQAHLVQLEPGGRAGRAGDREGDLHRVVAAPGRRLALAAPRAHALEVLPGDAVF